MRDDVRQLLAKTLDEIQSGFRTLDPVTELDIVLTEHNFQIVKLTRRERAPFTIEDDLPVQTGD